jgi:D-alanyl-D-alanine dipeptidase
MFFLLAATQAGLINYPYEFWHFSFGDRYEAYWHHRDHAMYGPVKLDQK